MRFYILDMFNREIVYLPSARTLWRANCVMNFSILNFD